uniref:Uncharacterized protein n=1 Tax=Cajanus cajan TaxID=3821 RepID=A0A151R6K9_CAJCA|nr:hypothetical protein KK1_040505 [Cajanus cajan]
MQNSGIMIVAQSVHFSTKNDNNPIKASMCYFGVIEDIWEVDYGPFRVPVFKCKWVDSNSGVKIDEFGFTLVDLNKVGHKEEPFIMAIQVKLVFYVTGPSNNRWSVALQGRSNNIGDEFGSSICINSLLIWDIPNTKRMRRKTLSIVAERWRQYKTTLTNKYIFGEKKGQFPGDKNPTIDQETWNTFIESRMSVEFLDILDQQAKEGSFVSHGRQDILTVAIGKPEHTGRVRAAGRSHTLQTYFGPQSSSHSSGSVDQLLELKVSQVVATYEDKLSQLKQEMQRQRQDENRQLKDDMQRQLQEYMQSLSQQFQQKTPPIEPVVAHVSTKGSCAATNPSTSATDHGTSNKCELFVDGSLDLVGIGRIHMLGSVVHHQTMGNDMVRVSVLDVRNPKARVPVPTQEVQTMEQALNTFLQWPYKLVKVISTEVNMEDDNRPKQVPWAPEVFGFCSNVPLFIHKLSVDKGNDHIYGFLEPELIQKIGNKTEEIQAYIQNWMSESNKKVYLVPYFSNAHWQLLIICPMDNISVCICSMHKPPPADFKQLLDK